MASADPYSCPNCQARLTPGLERCPGCEMRLRGPQAIRLWQVQQQLAVLTAESRALIAELLQSPAAPGGPPAPGTAAGAPPHPKRALSGQQILLGLGAVLLLSAAAAFLVVIWEVVGLAGQAAIMAGLTATAAAGAALGTRRSLPAAAETAALVATGLILVDLAAAHRLNLAGLGGVPLDRYWAYSSALAGAILVGCDLVVPRARAGTPLRRIRTYRPAAAVALAAATWLALHAAHATGAWLVAGLLLVALVDLAAGMLAVRLDEAPNAADPTEPPTPTNKARFVRWVERLPVSALILCGSGVLAVAGHLLAGLRVGYLPVDAAPDRYAAFGLLLVVPVLATACSTRLVAPWVPVGDSVRRWLPVAAVTWAAPVLVIPLLDAHILVMIGVAVALAVALTCVRLGLVSPDAPVPAVWVRVLTAAGSVAQPLLACAVVLLAAAHQPTLRAVAANSVGHATVSMPLVVLPALAWAASSAVATVRLRRVGWAWVTQAAALLAVVRAVADADPQPQMAVMLVAFGGNAALAAVAAHRAGRFWSGVEVSAVLFGGVYGTAAALATVGLSPGYLSLTLYVVGVLILGYAAAPQRLGFAYLGSLVISAGTSNLLSAAEVGQVEAYTLPLALLLAGIGAVQWHRDPSRPTLLIAGPALSLALAPSLLVAVRDGDSARLAAVTLAVVAVLVIGLVRRWKSPVTVGGLVLAGVAVTQGGPLIGYVPGWVILGVGAAALLVAGVLWEKAVVAGRRANAWFGALT